MRFVGVLLFGTLILGGVLRAAGDENRIVPAGAKLEQVFARSGPVSSGMTEGPAAAPDGSIFFSFIAMGREPGQILRFDRRTGETSVFQKDSRKSNGLAFDSEGFLIACEGADFGGRAIARYNLATGKRSLLADQYQGKPFNAPNDLTIDRHGRTYFTDPKYVGAEKREQKYRAVYRVDRDRSVCEITHDVEKPNGVALSPNGKTLYVADTNSGDEESAKPVQGAMKIYAFPLDEQGLVAGERKTLWDFGAENGCDGMTVDVEGNLYLTVRSLTRPGILVLDPEGKEMAFLATSNGPQDQASEPRGMPSNVEFGRGNDRKTLYVTMDLGLYRVGLNVPGWHVGE
jgi:gluconolactonase